MTSTEQRADSGQRTAPADKFLSDIEEAMRPREDIVLSPVLSWMLSRDGRKLNRLHRNERTADKMLSPHYRTGRLSSQVKRALSSDLSYRRTVFAGVVLTSVLWMLVGVLVIY